ncbi:MAG: hypothetical protein CL920_01080 [Deltaproteobacteria bacterium]|nr:hypothetical protein [Deltaproteobacteria bacterium]MBU47273.1 hypothetical protein [Deltaproteobacteria bacterium]
MISFNAHTGRSPLSLVWLGLALCLFSAYSPKANATPPPTKRPATRPPQKAARTLPPHVSKRMAKAPTSRRSAASLRGRAATRPTQGTLPPTPRAMTLKETIKRLADPYGEPPPSFRKKQGEDLALRKSAPKPLRKLPKMKLFSSGSLLWVQMFGMLFALGIIVVMIYAVLRWISKQAGFPGQVNQGLLSIEDRISLEPQKGLMVVGAGSQYFLIATHEQGVTMLHQLDSAEVEAWKEGQPQPRPFWQRMQTKPETQTPDTASPSAIPTKFEVISDGQKTAPQTQED